MAHTDYCQPPLQRTTGHGLILALQDASKQTWDTLNGWESITTYAGTTLKVLPDDAARGSLASYTTPGSIAVSNWAVAQKSDYEAIFNSRHRCLCVPGVPLGGRRRQVAAGRQG